jgi:hypothetical protein
VRVTTALIAWLLISPPVTADDWQQYENSNFIAFSNGPANDVYTILNELELVRAAIAQTPGFFIPEDRPRILVLLPADKNEFSRLAPYETMAGFAQQLDDSAAIVLPIDSGDAYTRFIIRHEFAHTLLFNEWFDYPHWYAEGFAEVVSSIDVNQRRNRFTIGEKPERYGRRIKPRIDWDELVSTNFDAHKLAGPELIQAAYAQNWLLIHYLTLNENEDFSSELDRYFALVAAGERSNPAFETAFGRTASDFWDNVLERYGRRPPTTTRDFDPAELDLEFTVATADEGLMQPLLTYFTDKADARRRDLDGLLSLDTIAGQWDQLKFAGQCAEPLTFTLRAGNSVMAIEGFYSAPGAKPIPALFALQRLGEDSFQLTNVTAETYPNVAVTSDYRVSMRNNNVICLDELPVKRICGSIFHRCGQRN